MFQPAKPIGKSSLVTNLCFQAVMISECKTIRRLFRKRRHGPVLANHLLILNLSFADFLMGIYLFMLGVAGAVFSGTFCENQLVWCSGLTCHVLGSLVVISSETSVVTMIILTSFRLLSVCKVSNVVSLCDVRIMACRNQTFVILEVLSQGCNEWRGPFPWVSPWAIQLRRNIAAMPCRLRRYVRFD